MYPYIAFDPGGTTGVACFDYKDGILDCVRVAMFKESELDEFLIQLEQTPPNVIRKFIVEEYRVYAGKATAHIGSKVKTAQVIGQIKSTARRLGVDVVEQPATILKIAQMWSQVTLPKKHEISHWASAYNHGYYYLHKEGLIKAKVLEDKK